MSGSKLPCPGLPSRCYSGNARWRKGDSSVRMPTSVGGPSSPYRSPTSKTFVLASSSRVVQQNGVWGLLTTGTGDVVSEAGGFFGVLGLAGCRSLRRARRRKGDSSVRVRVSVGGPNKSLPVLYFRNVRPHSLAACGSTKWRLGLVDHRHVEPGSSAASERVVDLHLRILLIMLGGDSVEMHPHECGKDPFGVDS